MSTPEERIAGLEKTALAIVKELQGMTGDKVNLMAEIYALRSYVVRLAQICEQHPDHVLSEIENLRREHLADLLQKAEDTDPGLAAGIDDRRLEDLPDAQED